MYARNCVIRIKLQALIKHEASDRASHILLLTVKRKWGNIAMPNQTER